MGGTRMGAGDEGVKAFNLMNKSIGNKEFERTISHRRLRAEACIAQPVKQFIGAQGTMLAQQYLKCCAAHRRETQPLGGALGLGGGNPAFNTVTVIVGIKADRLVHRRSGLCS